MGACWSSYVATVVSGEPVDLKPDLQPIRQLGHGASAGVWLCKDAQSQEVVAVKLLRRGLNAMQARLVSDEILIQVRALHSERPGKK